MSEEQEQEMLQRAADLIAGNPVPSHVLIGLDVCGRGLPAPIVQLRILGSRVILRIEDEQNPEAWVEVVISEELLARVVEEQEAVALEESYPDMDEECPPAEDVFDAAWDALAEQSRCDARGGAEYRRVRDAWDRVFGKMVAMEFILPRANEGPDQKPNS